MTTNFSIEKTKPKEFWLYRYQLYVQEPSSQSPCPPPLATAARETLLESKLRMATSALESILKELKKK
ncbi:MAG: hypothetical protein IJB89_02720 [Akkermansia sp.]|nr:hypothetical protein [Akkermansia sp.]